MVSPSSLHFEHKTTFPSQKRVINSSDSATGRDNSFTILILILMLIESNIFVQSYYSCIHALPFNVLCFFNSLIADTTSIHIVAVAVTLPIIIRMILQLAQT